MIKPNQDLIGRRIISVNPRGDAVQLDDGRVLYLDACEVTE